MPGSFWNVGENTSLCPQLLKIKKTNAMLLFIILLPKILSKTYRAIIFFFFDDKDILLVQYLLSLTHWGSHTP